MGDARHLSPSAQEALRLRAVGALVVGRDREDVAAAFGVSLKAVDTWWAKWQAGGQEALAMQPRGKRVGVHQVLSGAEHLVHGRQSSITGPAGNSLKPENRRRVPDAPYGPVVTADATSPLSPTGRRAAASPVPDLNPIDHPVPVDGPGQRRSTRRGWAMVMIGW